MQMVIVEFYTYFKWILIYIYIYIFNTVKEWKWYSLCLYLWFYGCTYILKEMIKKLIKSYCHHLQTFWTLFNLGNINRNSSIGDCVTKQLRMDITYTVLGEFKLFKFLSKRVSDWNINKNDWYWIQFDCFSIVKVALLKLFFFVSIIIQVLNLESDIHLFFCLFVWHSRLPSSNPLIFVYTSLIVIASITLNPQYFEIH